MEFGINTCGRWLFVHIEWVFTLEVSRKNWFGLKIDVPAYAVGLVFAVATYVIPWGISTLKGYWSLIVGA